MKRSPLVLAMACMSLGVSLGSRALEGQETKAEQKHPLVQLTLKCGRQIPWVDDSGAHARVDRPALLEEALKKAAESKRLVLWYVYAIDAGRHIKEFNFLDRYMRAGVFTDPDVVALTCRKFIPLRMAAGRDVGRSYGLKSPDKMEPALLFLKEDGTVVHEMHRIRSMNADFIMSTLRLVLAQNPDYDAPSGAVAEARRASEASGDAERLLALAEEQMLDGAYADAERALAAARKKAAGESLGRACYAAGVLHRRRRQAEPALKALEEAAGCDAWKTAARMETALVFLRLGRFEEARKIYQAVLKDDPRHSRAAEARYRLGVCHYLTQDEKKAADIWKELAESEPETPWAWRAAACVAPMASSSYLGISGLTHGQEDPLWPAEGALAELRPGSEWPRDEKDLEDIARRAVEFLIRHQRSDGSWPDSRYVFGQGRVILPNVWTAVTAMCSAALLEWRELDPERIDRALEKATEYLLNENNLNRGKYETSYADAYRMVYFSKRSRVFPNDKDRMTAAMNDIIQKLAESQKKSGHWWHEYTNPFITGTVLYALATAREAGAQVDAALGERGAQALLDCRRDDGTYPYQAGARPPKNDGKPKPGQGKIGRIYSAGRMVVCEFGLKLWEKGSAEAVERGLRTFLKYHDRYDRVRKSDTHSDGELAGFFYFHSFYPATEAARLLEPPKRDELLGELRKLLVRIPEVDGSFAEDHESGKSYATGMALLCLRNVRETPVK
ncbi:MAG: tetratricopeptide repeat protein [Planctomycetes bacterium]|nr:tetratricopeptide repeat protein [Planctomycetota bacterium]